MNQVKPKYLIVDEPERKTRSFVLGGYTIAAPSYIPEIGGNEDVEVLLKFSRALERNNPIMVPGYRWASMAANPRYKNGDLVAGRIGISELLVEHPAVFYEPPEMFRYSKRRKLITYALKGDRQLAKNFRKALEEGDTNKALAILPEFFRPFARRQLKAIYNSFELDPPTDIGKTGDIDGAWFDREAVDSYPAHIGEIINDAAGMPRAAIIPTVPPLMKTSEGSIRNRILSTNRVTSFLCRINTGESANPVRSYFHLYVDTSIIGTDVEQRALDILERGLDIAEFCGVAVTITSYEDSGRLAGISNFINEVVNRSHSNNLPVILPRSDWYGLFLTDCGVQAFSSMLNGRPEYAAGGGDIEAEDKFGKVPVIDVCREMKLQELREFMGRNGGLSQVPNLPNQLDLGLLASDSKYRINFAKPQRMIHVEEARRIRRGQLDDVRNPAKRYFERSEHERLRGA